MRLFIFSVAFFISVNFSAQGIVGLWKITIVTVGEDTMTPVAKWIRINQDHSFEGGNGWTKNSEGVIKYSKDSTKIQPISATGLEDPFGPFELATDKTEMTWKRLEEGMNVVVSLKMIDHRPKGPADKLQGLWSLEGSDELIFIRPDMRYRIIGDRADSGFWHIDGHRPILTLISRDESKVHAVYDLKFRKENLLLKSSKEGSTFLRYVKLRRFPE